MMQSAVRHVRQVSRLMTRSSTGDTVDATKLNCPIGHTCLQNTAPANSMSTAIAAMK